MKTASSPSRVGRRFREILSSALTECEHCQNCHEKSLPFTNDSRTTHSHSKIRASVLGKEMTASPTGLSAYRLIVSRPVSRSYLPLARVLELGADFTDPQRETSDHPSRLGHDDGQRSMDYHAPWPRMSSSHGPMSTTKSLIHRRSRTRQSVFPSQHGIRLFILIPYRSHIELMNEQASTSWTAEGSLEDLLKSFEDFPPWIKDTFKYDLVAPIDRDKILIGSLPLSRACPDISLWQLRDMVSGQANARYWKET